MSEIATITPRQAICELEDKMRQHPMAINGDSPLLPLKHTFGDGIYVRDLFIPKGTLVVGKIHRKPTLNFLLSGEITVLTEDGVKRLKAPMYFIAPAGSKKVGYTHEDTVWINVHATKETDLEKIEEEVIAKSYEDLDKNIIDVSAEESKILELAKESL